MNPVNYTHPCGLMFTTERLMSYNEDASHDISIVCLWLPNSAEDPMILIDWYCGEPNPEYTKKAADKYIATLKPETIINLLDCQDMDTDDDINPDLENDPARRLIYRLVSIKSHLNMRAYNIDIANNVDEFVRHEHMILKALPSLIDELIQYINTNR